MLAPTKEPLPYTVYRTSRWAADGPPPPTWQRVRRVALTAALLSLIPALVSFASTMSRPSNSSFFINAVEWMRDNGARGLVNTIENYYYSLTAPAKGGPALRELPGQKGALALTPPPAHHVVVHHYVPPPIKPLTHGLPGEGIWHATFADGGARPPVLITSFRPEPIDYPQVVVGVAWVDHTRTSTQIYPGIQEPGVALPSRGPEEVPTSMRSNLVATFNSGFKVADSGGGFVLGGHTYAPLQDGIATIVRYTDGGVDVIKWTGGPHAPPNVAWARQNLPLIVNGGRPNPNLNDGPQWGATLGNAALVWRSAVGVDRRGNLIYVAGPDQGLSSLASTMIHAGAVRAMELDINTYWTSFISYRFPGAHGAANLLATMDRSPLRYLSPDDRDFFAVYLR
jgi:phosphodiester glycosidase